MSGLHKDSIARKARPVAAEPTCLLVRLVRLLARQAARETIASVSASGAQTTPALANEHKEHDHED